MSSSLHFLAWMHDQVQTLSIVIAIAVASCFAIIFYYSYKIIPSQLYCRSFYTVFIYFPIIFFHTISSLFLHPSIIPCLPIHFSISPQLFKSPLSHVFLYPCSYPLASNNALSRLNLKSRWHVQQHGRLRYLICTRGYAYIQTCVNVKLP